MNEVEAFRYYQNVISLKRRK